MQLRFGTQSATVADEVSALASVTQPILSGLLYALHQERVLRLGGHAAITLWDLAREMRDSPGDVGVCFEYAVHDALRTDNPMVGERVDEALRKYCKVSGDDLQSILFGAEKAGSQRLIETVKELLTDDSQLMNGARGRPVKLRRHIDAAAAAFRTQGRKSLLPQSISGLWRADLFVGQTTPDRWVGTTVKSNASSLRAVRGLRLANRAQQADDVEHRLVAVLSQQPRDLALRGLGEHALRWVLGVGVQEVHDRPPRPVEDVHKVAVEQQGHHDEVLRIVLVDRVAVALGRDDSPSPA